MHGGFWKCPLFRLRRGIPAEIARDWLFGFNTKSQDRERCPDDLEFL